MLKTTNLPGSSAAYCPMLERNTQWAFFPSTAETIAHAVNVEIRLSNVSKADTMMRSPAQNATVSWFELWRLNLTSVVTLAELNRTPSSVDSNSDMKTIVDAYRCVMYCLRSFPSSIAHAR